MSAPTEEAPDETRADDARLRPSPLVEPVRVTWRDVAAIAFGLSTLAAIVWISAKTPANPNAAAPTEWTSATGVRWAVDAGPPTVDGARTVRVVLTDGSGRSIGWRSDDGRRGELNPGQRTAVEFAMRPGAKTRVVTLSGPGIPPANAILVWPPLPGSGS